MKKSTLSFLAAFIFIHTAHTQNVGIGTITPNSTARLHVSIAEDASSGFLVTGNTVAGGLGTVPDLGAGSRLMFYPAKGAFRAGAVDGTQWNNSSVGIYSTAIGYGSLASGSYSTSIGYQNTAINYAATAFGYSNLANGIASFATGNFTVSSGDYSFAAGRTKYCQRNLCCFHGA